MAKILVMGLKNKEWNDKKFIEVNADDGRTYSIWQYYDKVKLGDSLEGTVVEKGDGKTPQFKISGINDQPMMGGGKGGFQKEAPKPESFAAAYSKDIAVALIGNGTLKDAKQIDATLIHYFNLFMGQITGKAVQ